LGIILPLIVNLTGEFLAEEKKREIRTGLSMKDGRPALEGFRKRGL